MRSARRFDHEQLASADLIVDAIYQGLRAGNAGDDPLPALIGVSNQGGFRYLGRRSAPRLIVLTSSFDDLDWPDHLDRSTGILTYFGDNKRPGRALHETPRNGNRLLQSIFAAAHSRPAYRATVPPVLVFGSVGPYRDMSFLGLAVPGSLNSKTDDDLVAVWKSANGQRFQNYRSTFTILNVPTVSRAWLRDIANGSPASPGAPASWNNWVKAGSIDPLAAQPAAEWRTREQQLPSSSREAAILDVVYNYFKDQPVAFEGCAAKLAQLMDPNFCEYELTRASRDGGRDAVGLYRVGQGPSAVYADFALEAKCYGQNNSVGVKEVSRLISRLRHRQFGVLVTTSFLNAQAYRELKEDRHPIVIIAGSDIADVLVRAGYTRTQDVVDWLAVAFPREVA